MTKARTGRTRADDAARKRRSRANKHDHDRSEEKAANRARMAVYRAKQQAMKMAERLSSLLSDADRAEVEKLVTCQRHRLFCDWFRSRNMVFNFNPETRFTEEVLSGFMTKVDMHAVDLKVAEYEICMVKERVSTRRNRHITGANRIPGASIARAFANGSRFPQSKSHQVATSPVTSIVTGGSYRKEIGPRLKSHSAGVNRMVGAMGGATNSRTFAKGKRLPQTKHDQLVNRLGSRSAGAKKMAGATDVRAFTNREKLLKTRNDQVAKHPVSSYVSDHSPTKNRHGHTGANKIPDVTVVRAFDVGDRIPPTKPYQVAVPPVPSIITGISSRKETSNRFGRESAGANRMTGETDARAFAKGQRLPQTKQDQLVTCPVFSNVTSGPPRKKMGTATPTDPWAVLDGVSHWPAKHNGEQVLSTAVPSADVADSDPLALVDEEMADFLNEWQLDVADFSEENFVSSEDEEKNVPNVSPEATPILAGLQDINHGHTRRNSFDVDDLSPVLDFLDDDMLSW